MTTKRKSYSKQFKIDAVRLVDCTPGVRQIGLEQSAMKFGF